MLNIPVPQNLEEHLSDLLFTAPWNILTDDGKVDKTKQNEKKKSEQIGFGTLKSSCVMIQIL